MGLKIVVLAAGQGTRMKSALPKVLHPLGGKPLLQHVIETAKTLTPEQIIIIHSQEADLLKSTLSDPALSWICQPTQRGTGDAVAHALPQIAPQDTVLILYGDVPLITTQSLKALLTALEQESLGLLTLKTPQPAGLGRIVRDATGNIVRIVEEKDASLEEKAIQEVNTGICAVKAKYLEAWLGALKSDNAQNEYYLTDIIAMAVSEGKVVQSVVPAFPEEVSGVNDRAQLAELNQFYQRQQADFWMKAGVGIVDPARWQLRGDLQAEADVSIDVNVILEGQVKLHKNAKIGPNCYLKDCEIGEGTEILANSYIDGAKVGANAVIGPFARLRPGTILADQVRIGNFVEIKKATVATGTKINHLSYIGDATIGQSVNIGAGTITCNYDGIYKHQTIIEDGVLIGSDTQLIAPVRIGKDAIVAAGSTITKDVQEKALTLTNRLDQRSQPQKQRRPSTDPTDKRN